FGQIALRILPLATMGGIPLVAHFHGLDLSSLLRNRWYRWSLLRCLSSFDAIVVVGSHQRKWLVEHGADPEKVYLIPCGVPTSDFQPLPRPAGEQCRFIAVSRLVEGKGLEFSLRAF